MKIDKILKSIFHFLGGVYFAIALIAMATTIVIVGTILESHQGSHLFAAYWTYENPVFFILLAFFFINILFAALRRWPFKKRHIPFLITHLGLLMILSGTMIKNRWGLQGQLTVWEGSGSQQLLTPHTHSLLIQNHQETPQQSIVALNNFQPNIYYPFHFPDLKCKVIGYAPHVKQKYETWIKGSHAHIAGFPPIPVHEWNSNLPFPKIANYPYSMATLFPTWSLIALRTPHQTEALREIYLSGLMLKLENKINPMESLEIPLKEALKGSLAWANGTLQITMKFSSPLLKEQVDPSLLKLSWSSQDHSQNEEWTLALQGQDSLYLKADSNSWFEPFFTLDLIRPQPLVGLIEDELGNVMFFTGDVHGRVYGENFSASNLETMIAFDQGFGGYGIQTAIPIASFSTGREDKIKADAHEVTEQLKQTLAQKPLLSPPLQMFEQACQKGELNFAETLMQFLMECNDQSSLLYAASNPISAQIKTVLNHWDWQLLSENDKSSIAWIVRLFNQLENSWREGQSPLKVLEQHHWPLVEQLRQTQNGSPLLLLAQQINSLIPYLPKIDFPLAPSLSEQASSLSAYFKMYGIDYRALIPYRGNDKESFVALEKYWQDHSQNPHLKSTLVLETFLSQKIIPDTTPLKPEDQVPGIVVEVQQGQNKQTLALAYDASANNLKWPVLNGNYALRFQPRSVKLPYRVRLRQARQIHYPQSSQVYSYESDVLISEKEKPSTAHTLSMNRVYETWDGFRFYLSGIGHSADSGLKRIHLAVNHDPAKYFLTYPGALLVFLGVVLLFWAKKIFQK